MATAEQRAALLRIECPWCGAGPGTPCRVRALMGRKRGGQNRISTLDGGCHDARWQAALGVSAPVLGDVVAARRVEAAKEQRPGTVAVLDPPEEAPDDRPW
jgi:hypothetical protein